VSLHFLSYRATAGAVTDRANQASYRKATDSYQGGSPDGPIIRNGIEFQLLSTNYGQPDAADFPAARPEGADPLGAGYLITFNDGSVKEWRHPLPQGAGEYDLGALFARRVYTRGFVRILSEDGLTVLATFAPPNLNEGQDESQFTRSTTGGFEVINDGPDLMAGRTSRRVTLPAVVRISNGDPGGTGNRSRLAALWFEKVAAAVVPPVVTPETASVVAGATRQLSADKAGTWASSNTSVATVNAAGLVTAVAAGTATITFTASDGSGTDSSAITVTTPLVANALRFVDNTLPEPLPVGSPVDGIQVEAIDTTQANARVTSFTGAVTLDVDIALTPGYAVDGTPPTVNAVAGVATFNAVVFKSTATAPVAPVVTPETATRVAGQTVQLSADKAGSWTTSNASVATVSGTGLVNAVGAGTATITFTAGDGSGTDTALVTVLSVPSVSPTSSSGAVGTPVTLTANKAGTWASSNTAVATVSSSGVVSRLAVGTATITFTAGDGSGTATATITVTAVAAPTPPSVSPTTLALRVGMTQAVAASKAGTWSSANPSIATVSALGVVTAVAAGSATITFTAGDGSGTASCAVSVSPQPSAPSGGSGSPIPSNPTPNPGPPAGAPVAGTGLTRPLVLTLLLGAAATPAALRAFSDAFSSAFA
jgi:uncharacterized protein YjdB